MIKEIQTENQQGDNFLPMDNEVDMFKEDLGFNDNFDNFGAMSTPMEKYGDLLKDLTNFDPQIKDRINGWLGRVWNEESGKYLADPRTEPIMNEKCALWCIGFLKTYERKTNFITNIDQDEMKYFKHDIIRVVWGNFCTRDDFGITSESDRDRIANELEHSAFLVLAGAGNGKYTKFFSESVTRNENVTLGNNNQNIQTRRGGLLNTIKNRIFTR